MNSRPDFEALGRSVREALPSKLPSERALTQRARLVAWEEQQEGRRLFRTLNVRAWWALSAAVCVLLVASVVHWSGESALPPRAQLGALLDQQAVQQDTWVAGDNGPATLRFSEGSSFTLAQGTQARLVELSAAGVRLTLESGHVHADIVPGSGYHWVVQAGPHRVRVVGTVFDVTWDPETQRLDVGVQRGRVQVTSAEQGQAERLLEAGERLTIAPPVASATAGSGDIPEEAKQDQQDQDEVEPQQGAAREESAEPGRSRRTARIGDKGRARTAPETARVPKASERVTSLRQGPGRPGAPPEATVPPAAAVPPEASGLKPAADQTAWKRLAQAGRYADAVVEARGLGVDGLLQSASASDLLLLADAARLSSAAALAEQALLSIRKRFPEHPNADVACFALGRLAFEVRRDDRAAVRWFEAYLQSSPGGAMAEGARGRLLRAWLRLGERERARSAAEDYLRHHPRGRHVNVAQSLLGD